MKTIHKYTLEIRDEQEIRVPARAEFLTAQMQFGKLCVWAMVDTENKDNR